MTTPEQVHVYWFGVGDDWAEIARRNHERWFRDGKALDAEIRERFGDAAAAALDGTLDDWLESPRGAMALVLLLDQFPRHIHRGSARAFASDAKALSVCREGIRRGLDDALSAVEQSFFYLPLEHAEDLEAQEQIVELLGRRASECAPELRDFVANALRYAEQHRDIVARFGRFPHRNEVLGRASRLEEQAYLEGGGERFGQ